MNPKHYPDYIDWTEIMTGPEMAEWIKTNDKSLWIEMRAPYLFWLHPKLYLWWKLRYSK